MGKQVVVASPKLLHYGNKGEVYMGQVLELEGLPNDHKLLAPHIAYLRELEPNEVKEVDRCVCGRDFITLRFKQDHMRKLDHEMIDLDAPVGHQRQRGPNGRFLPISEDGGQEPPLELEGSPVAPKPGVNAPLGPEKGMMGGKVVSDGRGGAKEVFRIGGGAPVGIQ